VSNLEDYRASLHPCAVCGEKMISPLKLICSHCWETRVEESNRVAMDAATPAAQEEADYWRKQRSTNPFTTQED
jgi:hypothetical protein